MTESEIQHFAVKTIRDEFLHRNIGIKRIILFGSRAKGNARPDSDWDFIIITKDSISRNSKVEARHAISSKLAKSLIDVELIIKDEDTAELQKNNVGSITHYALKDGVEL